MTKATGSQHSGILPERTTSQLIHIRRIGRRSTYGRHTPGLARPFLETRGQL